MLDFPPSYITYNIIVCWIPRPYNIYILAHNLASFLKAVIMLYHYFHVRINKLKKGGIMWKKVKTLY